MRLTEKCFRQWNDRRNTHGTIFPDTRKRTFLPLSHSDDFTLTVYTGLKIEKKYSNRRTKVLESNLGRFLFIFYERCMYTPFMFYTRFNTMIPALLQ